MSSLHFDHGDDAATLAAEMLALPEDEALSLATGDGAAHNHGVLSLSSTWPAALSGTRWSDSAGRVCRFGLTGGFRATNSMARMPVEGRLPANTTDR